MQSVLRPYATTGVAIVGASLIAVTPAAVTVPDVHVGRDVVLTADPGDFLTPWIDQFNAAANGATVLANNFLIAPFVALQQFIANQIAFGQEIANDPTTIPAVVNEMQEHARAVLTGFSMLNIEPEDAATTILHTLSGSDLATFNIGHDLLYQLLPALVPAFLPPDADAEAIVPIVTALVNFISSPLSGMIMGMVGPLVSPFVALLSGITEGEGLSETLANVAFSFFNGATLNLDFVLPLLDGVVPPGTLTHLDLAFGGLLSTGVVNNAPYTLFDDDGNVITEVPAVGGSIFNSVGLTLDASAILGQPLELDIQSHGVGPIAAMMAWNQTITGLLGGEAWSWSGKNGTPPAAEAPLGISFPTIPTDLFDDGGAGAGVADAIDWTTFLDALGGPDL